MKTAIIFVLLLALGAAAYFTKPSQATFKDYVVDQGSNAGAMPVVRDQVQADQYIKGFTFLDRYLWVSVRKDGRTTYTGAFNHWFSRDRVVEGLKNARENMTAVQINSKQ